MKKILLITALFVSYLNLFSQVPDWAWAKSAGGASYDMGNAIATDAIGNIVVTGNFVSPTITFGTTTLTNSGENDIFVVKYDSSGNVLWAKSAGGVCTPADVCGDISTGISTDFNGNIIITGYFVSPIIAFDSTKLTNSGSGSNIFVVKYDPNGNVIWAKSAGGTSNVLSWGISTDASGNIIITGYFRSPTLTFDSLTLSNSGENDIFVVKYDSSGNVLWVKSAGGASHDYGNSISTDAIGNIVVTGSFRSLTLTFDSLTLSNNGDFDIFIVKYDSKGNVLWAKSAGGASSDAGYGIATDVNGNIVVTGYFNSPTIAFDSTKHTNSGENDIFVVKYDSSGNILWAKSASGTLGDEGYSISTDANGNIIITGTYYSPTLSFDSFSLSNSGENDIFVVKYNSNGNVLWAKSAGGTLGEEGYSVSTDANGNIIITGFYNSPTIVFGKTTLTNSGLRDFFVVKLSYVSTMGIVFNHIINTVKVYPNPSSTQVIIDNGNFSTMGTYTAKIVNALGQQVFQSVINQQQFVIDESRMGGAGVYTLYITDSNNKVVAVKKIVLQ
jgi:hypothetical protein